MSRLLPVSIVRTYWHRTTCLSKRRSSSTSSKVRFLLLTCTTTSIGSYRELATTFASAEMSFTTWRCLRLKCTSYPTWKKVVNWSLWRSQSAKGLRSRLMDRATGSCDRTHTWSRFLPLCYASSSSISGGLKTTKNSPNLQGRSSNRYSTCSWAFTHLCHCLPHGTNEMSMIPSWAWMIAIASMCKASTMTSTPTGSLT